MKSKHTLLPVATVALGLIAIAADTFFTGGSWLGQWLESMTFYALVDQQIHLELVIGIIFVCYFYCVPLNCWRHGTILRSKPLGWILLIPTAYIAINASWLIPSLIQLLELISNGYWKRQIILALIALVAMTAALLGLVLRISMKDSHRWASAAIWSSVALAYFLVGIYILQSHFPVRSKILIITLSALAIFTARLGLRADTEAR